MKKTAEQTAQLALPIHKQGDDLGHYLEHTKDNTAALTAYAEDLGEARAIVEKLVPYAPKLTIQADTHCIFITGPVDVMEELNAQGVGFYCWDEEVDEEDE